MAEVGGIVQVFFFCLTMIYFPYQEYVYNKKVYDNLLIKRQVQEINRIDRLIEDQFGYHNKFKPQLLINNNHSNVNHDPTKHILGQSNALTILKTSNKHKDDDSEIENIQLVAKTIHIEN